MKFKFRFFMGIGMGKLLTKRETCVYVLNRIRKIIFSRIFQMFLRAREGWAKLPK